MKERQNLSMFSKVKSFPFIKLINKDGTIIEKAVQKFFDFVYKRIDNSLFENENVVRQAIMLGGGSPRELLRILETAYFNVDENISLIDMKSLTNAIEQLAAETTRYLSKEELEKLQELNQNNISGELTAYDSIIESLLEKIIVMEYNDGSYMRVNPIVEQSLIYKQYVK